MHSRKILFFFSFLLLSACLPAFAQVKFTTVVSEKELGKEDYLQVEYVVENAGTVESLTPPAFSGFTVVSGPVQQTGMSIVNGATSKSEGISYVLKPTATGRFTIAGASAVVDGKTLRSNSVQVTVTNAAPKTPNVNNSPFLGLNLPEEMPEVDEEYVLRKGESAADKIKNNLFARLEVSKTSCYAGEPIVATYKLYSRLKSESRVTKRPSLSQFSVYDMVQPEAGNPTVEKINGKLYNAHIIRKVQLYPLQDGSFVLDPVEVDNTVRFLRLEGNGNKISMQQMLDDYMNGVTDGKMEEQKIMVTSKPVTITVKPLPAAGKPASFDGAVGKFTIASFVPQMEIPANETAVMNVVLKGQGNLPLINAPQVQWPAGVEGFEPTVKEDIDRTVAPINGTKMFQFSFIAKKEGPMLIPAVAFSYFDPAAAVYKTIRTDSVVVNISKPLKKPAQMKTASSNDHEPAFNWRKLLWLSPLAVLIMLAIGYKLLRKKTAAPPKTFATTQPLAEKTAVAAADPFEAAKFALAAVNSQLFYRETGKASWQILADKFNLTSSQLNKPVVVRLLQQHNASPETIQLLESVLSDCELALYTPVHTENDMRQTLEKAEKLELQLREL